MEVADLYVTLTSKVGGFLAGMSLVENAFKDVETSRLAALGGISGFGVAAGAALIGIGLIAVKMGSQFQASMELLHTMAQVPQSDIKGLGDSVLSLAGKVGYNPNSLAQALYHIESTFQSTGITGKTALDILKYAAEGARIGNADLVDTTTALGAVIVSGIPGVQNMSQAMGKLTAIVGSGDMTLQNLNAALSTGMVAAVKQYGLSLDDVGAALATFGDNNLRGQYAATQLRMAVQDLVKPARAGGEMLAKIGLSAEQLQGDLATGGLLKALEDLKDHLNNAGVTGAKVGDFLLNTFTKRAGTGISILVDQLDRVKSKYSDIDNAGKNFADSWARTQDTLKQKIADIRAGFDALLVTLGQKLIPIVIKALDDIGKVWAGIRPYVHEIVGDLQKVWSVFSAGFDGKKLQGDITPVVKLLYDFGKVVKETFNWMKEHSTEVKIALAAIGAVIAYSFFPITTVVVAFMLLYDHVKAFRDIVNTVAQWIEAVGIPTIKRFAETVSRDLVGAWHYFQDNVLPVLEAIYNATVRVFTDIGGWVVRTVEDISRRFMQFVDFIAYVWNRVMELTKPAWETIGLIIKLAWQAITTVFTVAINILEMIWRDFHNTILTYLKGVWDIIWTTIKAVWNEIVLIFKTAVGIIADVVRAFLDFFTGHWGKAWNDVKGIFENIWNLIAGTFKNVVSIIIAVVTSFVNNIVQFFTDLGTHIGDIWSTIWRNAVHVFGEALSMLTQGFKALVDGAFSMVEGVLKAASHLPFVGSHFKDALDLVKGWQKDTDTALSSVADDMTTWGDKAGTNLTTGLATTVTDTGPAAIAAANYVGQQIALGLVNGMDAKSAEVAAKAAGLSGQAAHAMAMAAQTASPSRLTMQIGRFMAQGLANGMTEKTNEVHAAARRLVTDGVNAGLKAGLSYANPADLLSQKLHVNGALNGSGTITPIGPNGGGGTNITIAPQYNVTVAAGSGSSGGLDKETLDHLHRLFEDNNQQLVQLLEQHLG